VFRVPLRYALMSPHFRRPRRRAEEVMTFFSFWLPLQPREQTIADALHFVSALPPSAHHQLKGPAQTADLPKRAAFRRCPGAAPAGLMPPERIRTLRSADAPLEETVPLVITMMEEKPALDVQIASFPLGRTSLDQRDGICVLEILDQVSPGTRTTGGVSDWQSWAHL